MDNIFSVRGVAFLALFIALAFVGMQLNFSKLIGSEAQYFTMFQFFGPIAGGFLGIAGAAVVFIAQVANSVISGKSLATLDLLRLLPMVFGALFFSQYKRMGLDDRLGIAIPLLCIAAFWLNPIGQQAWYYALFWTIPLIVKFLPDKLFLRSLGSTFTAHAVGGAIWVWTVPMAAAQYNALMLITPMERLLFAAGIAVSYVVFTNALNALDSVWSVNKYVNVEKRYVLRI
jgi:hypothetical protein